MGSVSLKIGDSTAHFRRATLYSSTRQLLMLASTVSTNLFALYAFSFLPSPFATVDIGDHKNLSVISEHVSLILREIEASERWLHQIECELAGYETLDPAKPGLPQSSSSSSLAILSPSAATPALASPLWYPPSPIPAPAPLPSPSSPPSCPTTTPPLAPPPTLAFSPSSSPRPASLSPATAASPFPDLSGTSTLRTPFHLVGHAGLAHLGHASPGSSRVVPSLVRRPNFSSLAQPLLMGRAGPWEARPSAHLYCCTKLLGQFFS